MVFNYFLGILFNYYLQALGYKAQLDSLLSGLGLIENASRFP